MEELHRIEKDIIKFILENGEVRWRDLIRGLVGKGTIAQGTLSKYLNTLQTKKLVDRKQMFAKPPYTMYSIPRNLIEDMKELTKAKLSPEERIKLLEKRARAGQEFAHASITFWKMLRDLSEETGHNLVDLMDKYRAKQERELLKELREYDKTESEWGSEIEGKRREKNQS